MSDEKKTIILNVTWLKKNPIFRKAMVSLVLGYVFVFSINFFDVRFQILVWAPEMSQNEAQRIYIVNQNISTTMKYYELIDKVYNSSTLLNEGEQDNESYLQDYISLHEPLCDMEEIVPIHKLRISPSYFREVKMDDILCFEGGSHRYYLSNFLGSYEHNENILKRIFGYTSCLSRLHNHGSQYNDRFIGSQFRNPLNKMYFSMLLSFYDWYYIILFASIIFVFWIFFKKYKLRIK